MAIKYGWKRSLPDHRDLIYSPPEHLMAKAIPSSVDLRSGCPAVVDQGNLGSCTANAIAALVEFLFKKENKPYFTVSRLFIYYQERLLEGTISYDAGAEIRDGMKVVNTYGAPHESLWPYIISRFTNRPSSSVYKDGLSHKVIQYQKIDNTNMAAMKACLASGYPMVGGFSVYDSFESNSVAATGIVPYPAQSEQLLGGHAIMVVGYNDSTQRFICQNSWGTSWGDHGFFYMPYAYLSNGNLADDFWTATLAN
jgi:C1A family cysteine protease